MNKGNIPGFYYDEKKKKYFRIQANHLVPQGAKYSKGNVNQEKRQAKKRKIEHRKETERMKQAVKRNPVLQHPLTGGIGLEREHGIHRLSQALVRRDAANISQMRSHCVEVKFPSCVHCSDIHLQHAQFLSATNQMILAASHSHSGSSTLDAITWDWAILDGYVAIPNTKPALAAFHPSDRDDLSTGINSLSIHTYKDVPRVLVCAGPQRGPDIYLGPVPPPDSNIMLSGGIYLDMASPYEAFYESSIQQTTGMAAVMRPSKICILDLDANLTNSLALNSGKEYAPCIDWLDFNTVAFGCNSLREFNERGVLLWDTRLGPVHSSTSMRFRVRDRMTCILNPDPAGNGPQRQLLVSTNHKIYLFDTRMHSKTLFKHGRYDDALLTIPHVHQGSQLQLAANQQGLVAAVDRDNLVQVYSTKTGTCLASLATPNWHSIGWQGHAVRSLSWYEDDRAMPTLMACQGNLVVRWTSGEMQDEDDEG